MVRGFTDKARIADYIKETHTGMIGIFPVIAGFYTNFAAMPYLTPRRALPDWVLCRLAFVEQFAGALQGMVWLGLHNSWSWGALVLQKGRGGPLYLCSSRALVAVVTSWAALSR